MIRNLLVSVLIAGAALGMSCNVNEYCLNCAKGDGGTGDGRHDANDGGDGDARDASDASTCIPTGPEACNNKDDDCDGIIDEGPLPAPIGDLCQNVNGIPGNAVGECAGGINMCANGVVVCSKPPTPEQCDNKDNNCNGLIDEGDPGGGAVCGTNTGECVAGTMRCNLTTHVAECVGSVGPTAEVCNNRDDDCDGVIDNGVPSAGPCGGGPAPNPNLGVCHQGTLVCTQGTFLCMNSIGPSFELCDALDQDCDGNPTNGYDLTSDPRNCGACGNVCALPNAFPGCGGNPAACTIAACFTNFFNNDAITSNGCEYNCGHLKEGPEVCDGRDNDCNGFVDDGTATIPPIGLCKNLGACSTGTSLTCGGTAGWQCHYNGAGVSTQTTPTVDDTVIVPETRCDGIDNDCDGRIDEGQPNLGQPCDNGLVGDCRNTGTFVCNAANLNGPAVCNFTSIGPGMSAFESCDGRDNNCNGAVDEGANTGNLVGQDWIDIGNGKQMMKYEASRPDATVTSTGASSTTTCSRADVMPWFNVTYPQAVAACTAVGARLCNEQEWHRSCSVVAPAARVSGNIDLPNAGNVATTVEAEDYSASTPTSGTGDSFTVAAGVVTLTDAAGLFTAPMVGQPIVITGATSAANNGTFVIASLISATQITYANAAGVAQAFPGLWTVNTLNGSALAVTAAGIGDSFAVAGSVVTLTDAAGLFTAAMVGQTIVITGATSAANNGTFTVASFTSATVITYTNAAGVAQAYAGAWTVGVAHTWVEDYTPGFSGISAMQAAPDVGTNLATGATAANAPHLDFQFNVQKASIYRIWVLVYSPNANSNRVAATMDNAAIGVNNQVTTSASLTWQWIQAAQTFTFTAAQLGTHTVNIYMMRDGVRIDAIHITDTATTPALPANPKGGKWAYATTPDVYQLGVCNDHDLNPANDDVLATKALAGCRSLTGANPFDLSGNVKEWTLAHVPGQNPIRGGASNNTADGISCPLNFTLANNAFFFPNVGFRCCRN